jgi:hypothetical protein
MEQTVSTCPAWCHGKHLPGWRAHSRDVREIVNEFSGDIVVIAVTQYGDHDPQVSVALDTHHETAVAYLGSAAAAHLAACLRAIGQPGTLGDALDTAAATINSAVNHQDGVVDQDDAS